MAPELIVPTPAPAIEYKTLSVSVAKETDDVMVLFSELAKTVRQKGDYAGLVDELIKAIDGVGSVPTEFKEALWPSVRSIALRACDIGEALTAPKPV